MTSPVSYRDGQVHDRVEREWLDRLRTGDAQAFERLYRTYLVPLCDFAYACVRNRDVAQEIVQDLFCAIWQQRFTIDMPHGTRPYLYAAVRNRARNALRNLHVELSAEERLARPVDSMRESVPSPHDEAVAQDLAEALSRAIAALPPRCREVFTLLRYHRLTYREAARVLAISPKTVEIHMGRALAILRDQLVPWLRP